MVNEYTPQGCSVGWDVLDSTLRLTLWDGRQRTRAVGKHREETPMVLLKVAWETALDEGWEYECPFAEQLGLA